MSPISSAIRLEQVSVEFPQQGGAFIPALQEITGELATGKILTIIGPSGSGKSTLLSTLNLLCTPTGGTIWIEGKRIRDWHIPDLRRTVGMVFQTPTMLAGTVRENLATGPLLRGQTLSNPERYMEEVGLETDFLERPAQDLSGGQKQRVALARILVNQPRILLLDEVTSALDPGTANGIEDLIRQINGKMGVTIVWVTHHLEQAERVGEWTWFLYQGRLLESAPTASLFADARHPLTQQFLRGELSTMHSEQMGTRNGVSLD